MGLLKTTFLGALAAGNTVAAVGSFEAVNKMHADPDVTATEIGQEIIYRPFDNFSRCVLGDKSRVDMLDYWSDERKPLVGIDTKACNFIGNIVNRDQDSDPKNPFTQIIPQGIGMIATMPGSYIGSAVGVATGEVGLHLDID